jgi:putative membrane protein
MSEKHNYSLNLILKGAAMGIAEVIPGVSGGTIAFITGIYERLINAIKSVDGDAIRLLTKLKFKEFFNHIDGMFLVMLVAGMVMGIGVGIIGIGYLLANYPAPLWAFFFGLIIASTIYIGRQVRQWNFKSILALVIGFGIALSVTFVSPAEGSENLLWVFACGMIAISALILPGVSGSFILLLLGMYTVVRGAAEKIMIDQDVASLGLIAAFLAGCVVGLATFARILSAAFKGYKDITLALLSGFMLGSLRKIWPWRNVDSFLIKDGGQIINNGDISAYGAKEIQILREVNVGPDSYIGDSQTILVIISLVIGFIIIFVFEALDKKLAND